ncbi:hypothetical protein HPB52_012750 [Rhipicephalus sanguineus]|uniref:Uncharacterized protein n=1 Tax=Rhipicephalus sanguineus TaxID=34632 RepID=A0A9D4PRN6_RHISA|nr:hypothetical protein HPB52_012750 [Rhipicephalus sanguineus]
MEVVESEVGDTPSDNSLEDKSDPTRRAEDGDAEGWIDVTYRRKDRANRNEEAEKQGTRSRSPTRRGGKSIMKILRASKMPRLPRNDIKVIVRPRDGLNIRNTCRASLDEAIRHEAGMRSDEIVTICHTGREDGDENRQNQEINNQRDEARDQRVRLGAGRDGQGDNPQHSPEVHTRPAHARTGEREEPFAGVRQETGQHDHSNTTVRGNRVPMWAYFNSIMMRVSLYRKQIDFRKECGRLGHRPDVCPRPDDKLCPASGTKNPAEDHEWTPKCKLCGEAHPTADRTCRAKFKTPYMDGSEQEVKRPRPSTKKTDVLEGMINKLSDKMEKMFEMLVVRISDSEAERKAQALKHDKRLEELEKRIS